MIRYKDSPMMECINKLGICGCGCPDEVYKAIHEMLLYFEPSDQIDRKYLWQDPYEAFMCYFLNEQGFLDHGSSVYGSVLTEDGYKLLGYLNIYAQYNYEIDDLPSDIRWVEDYTIERKKQFPSI